MDPRTTAQDVMRCDFCETAVVQMHCATCLVNLCKACVGEHISTGESNEHKVVKFQARKSIPLYPRCKKHNKRENTMYCNLCDIPVCTKCIATDQHLGHKVSEILQIVAEKKAKFIKEQIELNETIYPTYQNIASEVQNRMSQLEKEYGDLSKAIKKHGENWHREIDKLVKKLQSEVDEMKNAQLQTLQKHLNNINKNISDIKDEIDSIDIAIDTNDLSKQLSVTSKINIYRNLPQKIAPALPKFIAGKIEGKKLDKLFGALSIDSPTSDKHGYSMKTTQKSPETRSSPPVKLLLDEPETVTTINTEYGILNDVACLNDEEIWTKGNGNDSTMKLFSINQGSLLNSITTKSGESPTAIAVTQDGDLVYTDYHNGTVTIVKSKKIEKEVIRPGNNWRPFGVCSTSSGDLLVTMNNDMYYFHGDGTCRESKVVRYSGSKEKQTIQHDDKGKPLYSSKSFNAFIIDKNISENRNLDICVADCDARAVVVVNQAGKLRFRYYGHYPSPKKKAFNPLGITTDSQSHILTADDINGCVHIIDQDGQFLRYIDCGLSEPQGLYTDTNDNLFVAQLINSQVKKIKYLL
ncbi:tripartite motif-containing protein 55-like [Saccostrea echinata]|uniref:tripartite motif-containing protein 55-like n=1 Tax=Saccostrea echinata TaxID=191078 RepID=UPI002A8277C2|nr:tripartite motif-containing protein 55-like [Saccostrea echinata]